MFPFTSCPDRFGLHVYISLPVSCLSFTISKDSRNVPWSTADIQILHLAFLFKLCLFFDTYLETCNDPSFFIKNHKLRLSKLHSFSRYLESSQPIFFFKFSFFEHCQLSFKGNQKKIKENMQLVMLILRNLKFFFRVDKVMAKIVQQQGPKKGHILGVTQTHGTTFVLIVRNVLQGHQIMKMHDDITGNLGQAENFEVL